MSITALHEDVEHIAAAELAAKLFAENTGAAACITSSFQAEDMVVLHLIRKHAPQIPVIFLETGYHFAETYAYRDEMAKTWSLNLVNALPKTTVAEQESALGKLYIVDPTQCCQIRKVEPLMRSLEPYKLWFTGLRREQSPTRKNLRKIELHTLPTGTQLSKISLLADWTWQQVLDYCAANNIPHLPLYEKGYLSIGCEPCTTLSEDPKNPRAGRWGGKKLECGIHTFTELEKAPEA
ncbi:MAG: phosphoadenylyl-sulfate reductase [Acidobacteriaceae bacterium]